MKGNPWHLSNVLVLTFLVALGAALLGGANAMAAEYMGAEICGGCHPKEHNDWRISGHPYEMRKAEDAKHAAIPLPEGYSWDEISYVIGGYHKKVRYLDKEGYIITSTGPKKDRPGKNQFNLETGEWSDYHPGEKKMKYDCGGCHATGYSKEGHQDGLIGIVGTWKFPGIECEACHGPGSEHVTAGGRAPIKVEKSALLCGKCHIRGKRDEIPAQGGYISHHAQFNELLAGPHKMFGCVTCHNPHKGHKFGIQVACRQCHLKQDLDFRGSKMQRVGKTCVDCHMARATRSAIARSAYEGDVRTHIFRINIDPKARMFTPDGKYAKDFITLRFACLSCHLDRDVAWAVELAKGIHTYGKK